MLVSKPFAVRMVEVWDEAVFRLLFMSWTLRTLGTMKPEKASRLVVGAARVRVEEMRQRAAVVYFILNDGD